MPCCLELATPPIRIWANNDQLSGACKAVCRQTFVQIRLAESLTQLFALQRSVMNLSLGYFTYDMLCCLYIDLDFANVVHHLCTMLGLAVGVCNGVVSNHADAAPGRD